MRRKVVFAAVCAVVIGLTVPGAYGFDFGSFFNKPDIKKAITKTETTASARQSQVYGKLKMSENYLILESPSRARAYLLLGEKIKELGQYLPENGQYLYISGDLLLPKQTKFGTFNVAYAINVTDYDTSYYALTSKGRSRRAGTDASTIEMKKKIFAELKEKDATLDMIRGHLSAEESVLAATGKPGKVLILNTESGLKYVLNQRSLAKGIVKAYEKGKLDGAPVIVTGRFHHPDNNIVVPVFQGKPQETFQVYKIYLDNADMSELKLKP